MHVVNRDCFVFESDWLRVFLYLVSERFLNKLNDGVVEYSF